MDHRKILEQIESILEQIPEAQREYFRKYFHNAPNSLLSTINIERRSANKILVEESEPIEKIYVLMKGTVKAIDFRVKGSTYEYARFEGVTILGSMECVFGIQNYMTTLITATPCTFLVIPRQTFESWIWSDTSALRIEAESMSSYLLEHTRENRVMLLLNGMERLMLLLVKMCESRGNAEVYVLAINRQELAEQTGSSVKTVNRSMKKLEESGFLIRDGHKVKIVQKQYASMRTHLDKILSNAPK